MIVRQPQWEGKTRGLAALTGGARWGVGLHHLVGRGDPAVLSAFPPPLSIPAHPNQREERAMITPENIRLVGRTSIQHWVYGGCEVVKASLTYGFDSCVIGGRTCDCIIITREAHFGAGYDGVPKLEVYASGAGNAGAFLPGIPVWIPPLPDGWDRVALEYAERLMSERAVEAAVS